MNRCLIRLFVLSVSLLVVLSFSAQVTIGMDEKAETGALLQLKEKQVTGGEVNATRGLGLPRVKLTNLFDLDDVLAAAEKVGNYKKILEGLVVYNVKDDDDCPSIEVGVYVWSLDRWRMLTGDNLPVNEDLSGFDSMTETLTDYEGNQYATKLFTDANGYSKRWMTQNLYSLYNKDGRTIGCLKLNPAQYDDEDKAVLVYNTFPAGTVDNYSVGGVAITGQTYPEFAEEYGLLYSWNQAKTACPRGWHLPSPAEWSDLAVAMGGTEDSGSNPYPYADYRDVGDQMKKNIGADYVSRDGNLLNWTEGRTPVSNGFNAVPSGRVGVTGKGADNWGYIAYFWTDEIKIHQSIYNKSLKLYSRDADVGAHRFAVRCVQD